MNRLVRAMLVVSCGLALTAVVLITQAGSASAGAWSEQSAPSPADATTTRLSAASCASATLCMAVGYYADGTGATFTLAERWNGSTWVISKSANHTATTS